MDPDGSGTLDFEELNVELRKAKKAAHLGGPPSPQSVMPPSPRLPVREDGFPMTAPELEDLARGYQHEGRIFEAHHAYERALQLYRRHDRECGMESVEAARCAKQVADVSNSLAMQYLQQDSFAAALLLLKKAEALAGRHKALLAITLNNLACYYRRRAQPKEALRYLLRALEIESKCREPHKPADTHLNACAVQSQLGRHQQAMQHCKAALQLLQLELGREICRGTLTGEGLLSGGYGQPPPDRMAVLAIAVHNLGVEQEHLELTAEAVRSYEQASCIGRNHLGLDHPITVTLTAAYGNAMRIHARKHRPVSAPVTPRRPVGARPSSALTERTSYSVALHVKTVSKVRGKDWSRPEPRPHQPRDPDKFVGRTGLALENAEGSPEEVLDILRAFLKKEAARVMTLFRKWDTDQNGVVSFDEFNVAMKRLGLNVATSEVKKLFMEFDPDDSGEVDFRELNKALRKGAGDASPRQHALSAGFRRS